jgi:hypothetical protein
MLSLYKLHLILMVWVLVRIDQHAIIQSSVSGYRLFVWYGSQLDHGLDPNQVLVHFAYIRIHTINFIRIRKGSAASPVGSTMITRFLMTRSRAAAASALLRKS